MSRYIEGDTVKLTAKFYVSNTLTNPTVTTLRVRSPSGTTTTPAVANPSTGVFTATFVASASGTWYYQWTGTGSAPGVEEGMISVDATNVP